MRRLLYAVQVVFLGLFIFTLTITLLQLSGGRSKLSSWSYTKPLYNGVEDYDPSLNRLNTIVKLEEYCDSLYAATDIPANNKEEFEKDFVEVVYSVVQKRFYHGYSYYGLDNNYLAFVFSKTTLSGYSAIVIPDDILKYPNAACSQQSIVMMEVLKAKGLKTRKVGFSGKKYGGHFCFEVFYKNSWHFYDPNLEPDRTVLNAYMRPSIAALVAQPDILLKAYKAHSSEMVMDIFPTYWYGAVNEFPAPHAVLFQKVTKVLSYITWFFFLAAFLLTRRIYRRVINKKHVWNSRIYFPQSQAGSASSYYPGITAPGA